MTHALRSLHLLGPLLALAGCLLAGAAHAQTGASPSIYTCTDAQGRRLTSDRPILACLDREQRELHRSGTVKQVIPPSLTQVEREEREAAQRRAQLERQRAQDQVRRDQAMSTRYPNREAHDAARREALAQTDAVVQTAERHIAELAAERKTLDEEMEFYRKEPSRAPAKLRRRIEEITVLTTDQQKAMAGVQAERAKINARFDEELTQLQKYWTTSSPAPRAQK